jgi:hypothetical protein
MQGAADKILWMQSTFGNHFAQRSVSSCTTCGASTNGRGCHACSKKKRVVGERGAAAEEQTSAAAFQPVPLETTAAPPEADTTPAAVLEQTEQQPCSECKEDAPERAPDVDEESATPAGVSDSQAQSTSTTDTAATTETPVVASTATTTDAATTETSQQAGGGDDKTESPAAATKEAEAPTATTEETAETAASAANPNTLIVEDSADELRPGQMRRGEFLSQVQSSVRSTAEEELAATGRSASDCPYIDYWLGYYNTQDSQHIQRALHRYVPESRGLTSAEEAIALIAAHVRGAVQVWVATGRITGVPDGVPLNVPGADAVDNGNRSASLPGNIFFKGREGGPRHVEEARTLQSGIRGGRDLDGGVRSRMESAFGYDFSGVRVHTDSRAAGLSNHYNARAFTVGENVVFGAGEYRPGTMVGDALIAHELAHVVQQRGSSPSASAIDTRESSPIEEEADRSAIGVVAALWGKGRGALAALSQSAMPRLRSGLRLSRCKSDGCVTGNLTAHTSGAFQGGWDANSYLSGGASWGPLVDPGTAGREGNHFKVQMTAPYSGKENLGVSQTMQHGNSNQSFLDGTAAYLGRAAGSVHNGDVNPEPVLDASDPFATRPWSLRYNNGIASFADVPGAGPGDQGYIDFVTCFHSLGTECTYKKCCVTWRWTVDLTTGNNTNSAAQQSQQCTP